MLVWIWDLRAPPCPSGPAGGGSVASSELSQGVEYKLLRVSCRFPSFFPFFAPLDYTGTLCLGIDLDLSSICFHREPRQGQNFTHKGSGQLQDDHPGSCFWKHKETTKFGLPGSRSTCQVSPCLPHEKDSRFYVHNITHAGKKAHPGNASLPRNLILLRLKMCSVGITAPRKKKYDDISVILWDFKLSLLKSWIFLWKMWIRPQNL